ncbi:MAG: DUF58 domain-containing protein [Firmicutes bacterium]|nr:DUF58 domain-containing protein [Bacillota bacterium]
MAKRIFIIFLWVIFAAALHLFGNNVGTLIIFVASVAIPVLSGVSLFVAARFVNSQNLFLLELPETCAKGEKIAGKLVVTHGRLASIFGIFCALICENNFTGERETLVFDRVSKINPFNLQTAHCGVLQVSVGNIAVHDPLGIIAKTLPVAATEQYIIIPPTGFPVDIPLMDSVANPDSEEYSASKAGMDISETYAIREYQPGDPIRSIHWKLTEKLDKVMVREFGLPIGSSVLLVLDTATEAEISPAGWDATAELFFSTTLALLQDSFRLTVGWQSAETGGFASMELLKQDDAATAIQELLLTYDKTGAAFEPFMYPQGVNDIILIVPGDSPTISQA